MNSKRIAVLFAAFVLLTLSAASASHFHNDSDDHHDCQLCLIQSNTNSEAPEQFRFLGLFCIFNEEKISVSDQFRIEIFYTNNSPHAPPLL